jgi:hypothetical protein
MREERMLQPRHPLELRGQRILASRPNRTHPAGRECAADGCDTRLSIYNGPGSASNTSGYASA